jgi:hypothetical protein
MVAALEPGVAHEDATVLAPVLWCRFPVFRHGGGRLRGPVIWKGGVVAESGIIADAEADALDLSRWRRLNQVHPMAADRGRIIPGNAPNPTEARALTALDEGGTGVACDSTASFPFLTLTVCISGRATTASSRAFANYEAFHLFTGWEINETLATSQSKAVRSFIRSHDLNFAERGLMLPV